MGRTDTTSLMLQLFERELSIGTWSFNIDGELFSWSKTTRTMFGFQIDATPSLVEVLGFFLPRYQADLIYRLRNINRFGGRFQFDAEIRTQTGKLGRVRLYVEYTEHNKEYYGLIKEVKATESNDRLATLFGLENSVSTLSSQLLHLIEESVILYDKDGLIVSMNDAAKSNLLLSGSRDVTLDAILPSLIFDKSWLQPPVGNQVYFDTKVPFSTGVETCVQVLLTRFSTDKSAPRIAIVRPKPSADTNLYEDVLTGLKSRHALIELLSSNTTEEMTVLAINLKEFAKINFVFGDEEGDSVLIELSRTLVDHFGHNGVVVRDYADRFFVVLRDYGYGEIDDVKHQVKAFLERLEKKVSGYRSEHYVTVYVGIAVVDKSSPLSVLANAQSALMNAKVRVGKNYSVFKYSQLENVKANYNLEFELREALENNQIVFWIQPQYSPEDTILGGELLSRWVGKDGVIKHSPAVYMDIAEATGLVHGIGLLAIEYAAIFLNEINESYPDFSLSINVSPSQMLSSSFVSNIEDIFSAYEANLANLNVEVTEELLVSDVSQVEKSIRSLRARGVSVSIDDYGTGYSNIRRLVDLDVTELKIDKSLIIPLPISKQCKAVVSSIVEMSHKLGFKTVAEGVESSEHAELCKIMGLDVLQGFHFSPAVPYPEFYMLIESNRGK
ncbi:EAL domain-containing protein [Vibrio sp. NH-UV-68]|uniref:EAL domain-containing protein n=1 Tax=unclassified Vibrio TaxID=2614977 RepID=UPI0036F31110